MAFLVSFVSEMKMIEFWNWNRVFSEFHENLRKRFWKSHFACLRIFRTKKVLFHQNWLCSCSTCPFFFFRRYWRDRCFFLIDIECWAIANTKATFILRFFWKENRKPWLGALSEVKYWQRKKSRVSFLHKTKKNKQRKSKRGYFFNLNNLNHVLQISTLGTACRLVLLGILCWWRSLYFW